MSELLSEFMRELLKLNSLTNIKGSKTRKKRVGRGIGSGLGKTCGRGVKGQKSRSGVAIKGFEGGQSSRITRVPKRGFNSPKKDQKKHVVINLHRLTKLLSDFNIPLDRIIDKKLLVDLNVIKDDSYKVKLLGQGNLKQSYTFKLDNYSESAKKEILKLGGTCS